MRNQIDMVGYKNEPRCAICKARDTKGNPMRDMIDAYLLQGTTYEKAADILKAEGNKCNSPQVYQHVKKHSPYIIKAKKVGSRVSRIVRVHAEIQRADSGNALQRIIDIGSAMIDNWWNKIENAPQLPVTEKLYIEALKEKNKMGAKTVMDAMMMEMDKQLIDTEKYDTTKQIDA